MKNPAQNPFQVGMAPPVQSGDDSGSKLFYAKIAKEEEEKAHNHKNLPHTIQFITDQIGEVFVKMVDIRQSLTKTKQLSKKKKVIEKMQDHIDNINKQIFSLTNYLNDLNLDK